MTPLPRRRASAALGLAALASLASLGSGCASVWAPQTRALLARAPGLPRQVEWAAVPHHPQAPLHCGPAAVAMLLNHAGLPATPEALAQAMYLPARGGSLQWEVLAAARRHGGVATVLPPQLPQLLHELAAGHPVLVLQNLGLAAWPLWHYAVVVGYDLDNAELLLRSGNQPRLALALATFEHTWMRSGAWAATVLAPGQLAATASEGAALTAALDFERAAPPAAAARQYRAFLQRWPASLPAAMGLGNSLAAAGDLAGAARALEQAAQRHDSAAAWNNLALARWQLGEPGAARAALAQAQRRVAGPEPQWRGPVQATAARLR